MLLTVHVKPRAKKESLEWLDEDTLKISVCAVAEKGKANTAVIKVLAQELKIAPSRLTLVRGATAKIKQIEIE
ncbi:DUF167 domain-containing protein [Candidatus Uhrbacteria bacterium]|nr:DUF167 domain-containing protein [Candidatus Uhrbacteria bacterium]